MSILVNGMEMPKNCYQCRMVDYCQYLWKPYDLDDYSDLQDMIEGGFTRADNCPLVEVPPHGRLIDADEFYEALTMDDRVSIIEAIHVKSILSEVTTVIPASEEGE